MVKTLISKIKHIISYLHPITIEQCAGEVSPYLEVNLSDGKYVLDTTKVNYSYGSLHKVFDQTFHDYNLKEREIRNALILGFGAGSVASLLTKKYGIGCKITGVEKDPVVIYLARKYFNLKQFKNLQLICEDAYNYVQTHSKKFDVIVVDIYIDEEVPKCFHQKKFLIQVARILQNNGVLFFNKVVNNPKQELEFNELTSNIDDIFGSSLTYKYTRNGTNNNILIHDRRIAISEFIHVKKLEENMFVGNKMIPQIGI